MFQHESRQRLGVYLILDTAPRDEVTQLPGGELHLHRHDIIHGKTLPHRDGLRDAARRQKRDHLPLVER